MQVRGAVIPSHAALCSWEGAYDKGFRATSGDHWIGSARIDRHHRVDLPRPLRIFPPPAERHQLRPPHPAPDPTAAAPVPQTGTARDGSGAMFDQIAGRYDLLNRIISLGIDQRWRKKTVGALAIADHEHVLDLADFLVLAADHATGRERPQATRRSA